MTETALLFNSLRMLSLNEEQKKEMIKRMLPLIDRIIEEGKENPFNPRSFWQDFSDLLSNTREVVSEPIMKDWFTERIEKINWIYLKK